MRTIHVLAMLLLVGEYEFVEYYLSNHYTNIIWQLLTFETETTIL